MMYVSIGIRISGLLEHRFQVQKQNNVSYNNRMNVIGIFKLMVIMCDWNGIVECDLKDAGF